MKEKYNPANLVLVAFDSTDVIATSPVDAEFGDGNNHSPSTWVPRV
ncbi:MAG: hypothetical protein J6C09_06320 [Clostridia bacterium]|nr:hypothetical protein [Clostridia bacterium]